MKNLLFICLLWCLMDSSLKAQNRAFGLVYSASSNFKGKVDLNPLIGGETFKSGFAIGGFMADDQRGFSLLSEYVFEYKMEEYYTPIRTRIDREGFANIRILLNYVAVEESTVDMTFGGGVYLGTRIYQSVVDTDIRFLSYRRQGSFNSGVMLAIGMRFTERGRLDVRYTMELFNRSRNTGQKFSDVELWSLNFRFVLNAKKYRSLR